MATFTLSIVTPEHILFEEEVESIVVPGAKGYLGVLANHAPLITPIEPGKMTVRKSSSTEIVMAISGGFLEVSQNKATVLADAVDMPTRSTSSVPVRRWNEPVNAFMTGRKDSISTGRPNR